MLKNLFTYTVLIFCALLCLQSYSQDYIETIEDDTYINSDFAQSERHKKYLKSDQEIIEFDEEQWQRIKRSIAEGMTEDYYELADSGGYTLGDADNPFKRSRKSFKRYWRKKNAHMAKRIPKEKKQKQKIDLPNFNLPTSSVLSNVLIAVVVVGLAVLIFFLFFNVPDNKQNRKISNDLGNVIPTEIPKTELELMLEKALKKEDYREAIRIYFIF
ncbi:hypothetical protein N9P38_01405, partial [Flavobacteriales bacterium]|nr:hypothetical protein [Flavobacteriales bacterium]